MNESNDMLKIVVGVVAVVILIGLVFGLIAFSMNARDNTMGDLTAAMNQMDQSKFDPFDNTEVKGSIVISALTEFKGKPVGIIVCTKGNPTGNDPSYLAAITGASYTAGDQKGTAEFADPTDWETDYNTNFKQTKSKSDPNYINPTATFTANHLLNGNDQVVGLWFVQK